MKKWWKSGDPWIWLTAASVAISIIIVAGLLVLIAVRGLSHFWPSPVLEADYVDHSTYKQETLVGEITEKELIPGNPWLIRYLIKTGNRELFGLDFRWVLQSLVENPAYPENLLAIGRNNGIDIYGYLTEIKEQNQVIADGKNAEIWQILDQRVERAITLNQQIKTITTCVQLREGKLTAATDLTTEQCTPYYEDTQTQLTQLQKEVARDTLTIEIAAGETLNVALANIVRVKRLSKAINHIYYPEEIVVVERREWGNFYGYLQEIKENGNPVSTQNITTALEERLQYANTLQQKIHTIEKQEIGAINHQLERLRLNERSLELAHNKTGEPIDPNVLAAIEADKVALKTDYDVLNQQLKQLYQEINRDSVTIKSMDGRIVDVALAKIVKVYQPNSFSLSQKIGFYFAKMWEFATDEPREANTEGGIFPAIFGTVIMVFIMSFIVTPFGVIAAVYLREYAKQGVLTRTIRIAVNNLAGVPSIVYGVFGLGFFVYFVGGNIDQWFFPEALPAPTFGTGGILWASLTLAILTVPVVIVSTEEGLSRIPSSIREGSLALGATKAETLWRTVLPMASPAMMTGLILAIARAAGEVAPLMLVGVVKLAPSLVIDLNTPFIHLDRKFMHLGFHIYDVGFQSPNVEAARPLVFATSFLLVAVIVILNLAAIWIRNHLREKYKALETA